MQQMLPQQPIPLHVLAEIQRAMAHASVVAKQTGGVPCNPNDIFMQGVHPYCVLLVEVRCSVEWPTACWACQSALQDQSQEERG